MREPLVDETFMELTLEDIGENIQKIAKSRAKKPRSLVTELWVMGRRIDVTVAVRPTRND